jgi:hypothetical protein
MNNTEEALEKSQEASVPSTVECREATEAEIRDIPHTVDHVPFGAWTAAVIGAAERFGYYSTVITWREYSREPIVTTCYCWLIH